MLANIVKGSILNSPTRLERIARRTRWLIRSPKKLQPIQFVHGILEAMVGGDCSFRLLATAIGMRLDKKPQKPGDPFDTISKPALWERFNPASVEFLKGVLAEMIASPKHSPGRELPAIPMVGRIIVEDSTIVNLDARHSGGCPAGANQHGAGAALRFQAAFDLVTGDAIRLDLTSYKRVDQRAACDVIGELGPGDLLLRDLGYYTHAAFLATVARGAHYLSRHLAARAIYHRPEGGEKLDLLGYLRKHAPEPGDTVDIDVTVGSGQQGGKKFPGRLVARRVPAAVEAGRLRRLGLEEKRLNKKYSAAHRKMQGWDIYITSLPRDGVGAGKIFEIYPLRWRVEIIFKACKSYTGLREIGAHRSNIHHVKTMLYAWLCLLVLATETGAFALAAERAGELRGNYLSLLKVVPKVFGLLGGLLSAGCAPAAQIIRRWAKQIAYHDRYERRNKRRNMATMLEETLGLPAGETSPGIEILPPKLIG